MHARNGHALLRVFSHNLLISLSPFSLTYFVMSITASSVQTGGVVIPAYQAATGALVRALENVASIVAGNTDDNDEQYAMQMAFSVPAADVPASAIVVIPQDAPKADEVFGFTFIASCKSIVAGQMEKGGERR